MARIHEEIIVVKLSKLHKEKESIGTLAGEDTLISLEEVVQELVGSDIIVEVEKAE
jgi:hypothetical protein